MTPIKITRKKFLKFAASAIVLPFLIIWDRVVEGVLKHNSKNLKIKLSSELPTGISFYDSLIINNDNSGLKIYSSKCTHLGCRINKLEDNKLTCPCHGSQYSIEGKVLKGPAVKPLERLNYKLDASKNELTVFDV